MVDKFHLLLDEVSEELQDLVANGKAFQFTLAHARTVEDAHMASEGRRELTNEQKELDRAANISATGANWSKETALGNDAVFRIPDADLKEEQELEKQFFCCYRFLKTISKTGLQQCRGSRWAYRDSI